MWACQGSPCGVRAFCQKSPFSFFVSLVTLWFGLLSHISPIRLSSGHSSLILTLKTNDAAYASLPSPHSLLVDTSVWAASPLVVAVRHILCGFLFYFSSYVALWDSKSPHWHACERVSYCVETSLPSWLPPQDGSLSLNLLSQFLSFIFCSTSFWRDCAAFLGSWCLPPVFKSCFVEVAQHSDGLLMNLWGRNWAPCPIPPPSWDCPHLLLFSSILRVVFSPSL